MKYLLFLLALFLASCATTTAVSTSPVPAANGGLGFIRSAGLIGIGIVVFFACWNSMKIYIAAIAGIVATVLLAIICRHYEKWFALIGFIALAVGLLSVVASLFVKHKGIFLAWRKK